MRNKFKQFYFKVVMKSKTEWERDKNVLINKTHIEMRYFINNNSIDN